MSVIAVLQRSPDTGLAIRQLFQTLPQRTRGKNESSETREFIESFEQLRMVQTNLKDLERSVSRWAKASKLLGTAAVNMASTLSRLNNTSTSSTDELGQRTNTVKILVAVRKKIGLVNVLLKERQLLIHLRHVRDRAASYASTYEANTDPDEKGKAKIEKWQARRTKAQYDYDSLFEQLLQGIKFTLEESRRKGIFMIFGTELKAFAESQHILFEACEAILAPAITDMRDHGGSSFATMPQSESKRSSSRTSKRSSRGSRGRASSSGSKSKRSSSASARLNGTDSLVSAVTLSDPEAVVSDEDTTVDSDYE